MNKLENIKQKAKELFELIDDYEAELFKIGIERGRQQVYDRVCNAFIEEMKAQPNKQVKDIPSAERILNASTVIRELFPDLNT